MSLIEVLISMFLLTVLVALYGAALNTLALTGKLRNENLAYNVASRQIETLRETPFASLSGSGTISDPLLSSIPSGSGSYAVVDHSTFTGMKEITVTVNWNDGQSRTVQIKTLAGSGGINP